MMIPMVFPRVAKFVETVAAPDFTKGILRDGRMYEEEVPKMKVSGYLFTIREMLLFVLVLLDYYLFGFV